MSLLKILRKNLDRVLFTTPSHNQKSPFIKEFEGFYKFDYSEIEGFDNLQNPTGIISRAQGVISEIYNTGKTFMLINGATSGILAIMLSILKSEDKILVARNCHKTVYNGAILTGCTLDWFMPEENKEYGIYGEIDLKKLEDVLKLNDYKALFITSPTYDGINSDIDGISKLCKQYGVYLVVDEAHGALYNFSDELPRTAIEQGADFSLNSLHKTAGGINPTALLHVNKDFEWRKVQDSLNLITTTSPSYPMLALIEANVQYLNSKKGKDEIKKIIKNISKFKKALKKTSWEIYEGDDPTKILIKGVNEDIYNKFKIEDELTNKNSMLFLCGIGTTSAKLNKLLYALKKTTPKYNEADFQPFPFVKLKPSEAREYNYTYINKEEALLKLSAEAIVPYPPCVPILYAGEAIQEWHLNYLSDDVKVLKK